MDSSYYDADYYLDGLNSGKSNYENYSWLPDLTLPMADHLKRAMRIADGDTVLDVGCARGYLVKALRMRGVNAFGYDTSEWAIANCDEGVKGYVGNTLPGDRHDHVVMKDVAEHIHPDDLIHLLNTLLANTRKSMLLIVPLTSQINGLYLRPEDNADSSHVIRWPLEQWMRFINKTVIGGTCNEFVVAGSWHYPGLKPASSQTPESCGFIHITRA